MNSNKKSLSRIVICLLALLTAIGAAASFNAAASQTTPSSVNDPLVTLSYVNNVLVPQIEAELTKKIKAQVEDSLASGLSEEMKDSILSYASDELLKTYEENLNELTETIKEYEDKIAKMTAELEKYKDEEIPKLEKEIMDQVNKNTEEMKQELKDMTAKMESASALLKSATEALTQLQGADSTYEVVHLTKGQKLMANSAVELIHRAGICRAISPFSDQGIADMTASMELYDGHELIKNNFCLIPRGNDGRGIIVESDEVYIMVRGEYTIE